MSPWIEEKGHVVSSRVVWRAMIVFGVLLACAALVLTAALYSRQASDTNKINGSLCALRADLQSRVDQTERFLHHPQSFPAFNDPNTLALIQNQVEGQQRTIDALSGLAC